MSRKHFNAIAAALRENKPDQQAVTLGGPIRFTQWERDCQAMASVCACHNGMFDRNRFLSACGMD